MKVKDKINQLQMLREEKEKLYKILEIRGTSDSEISEEDTSSTNPTTEVEESSSPEIELGCLDTCCKNKSKQ